MLHDIRFGIRMLRKQPGFTLIAVLTLMLGIGATAAVFNLIHGVLLTPPPYQHPEQLALMPLVRTDGQLMPGPRAWPPAQWLDWQKQAKSFEGIAAYAWTFNFLIRSDGSESMEGMIVSPGYFKVAGLEPILGRTFLDSEGAQGSEPVIILGYDLWQRKFNGDPNIIGKTIRMSRRDIPPKVVGIMPPGVRFLPSPAVAAEPNYDVNAQVDFWMPAIPVPAILKNPRWDVVGRLRPGVSVGQAQSELSVLIAQEGQSERDFQGFMPKLTPLATEMNRDGQRILLPLLGAAVLVFLIACGNVAACCLCAGFSGSRNMRFAVHWESGARRYSGKSQPKALCLHCWAEA